MERDFLELIKKAEDDASAVIEEAKARAAEIEKEGSKRASEHIENSRRAVQEQRETRLSEEGYRIKKTYDNKKTFLTVSLNDEKLKALDRLDKAAELVVERIIGG